MSSPEFNPKSPFWPSGATRDFAARSPAGKPKRDRNNQSLAWVLAVFKGFDRPQACRSARPQAQRTLSAQILILSGF